MKRFFTILLAVSLFCACGDIEPLPGENGDGEQIENGGNSGDNTDQGGENEGSDDNGNSGDDNTGDNGSGNEGNEGNEGNQGNEGNEGNQGGSDSGTTAEQGEIVLRTASEGWPTSYPTSQSIYTIEGQQFYLLNAAIYNTSNGMQFKKQTGYIANKSVFGNLVRIEVTKGGAHSGKMLLHIGNSEVPTETEIKPTDTANGYAFDCTSHNAKYFKLTNDGGGVVYLSEIRIVYLKSGSNTPGGSTGGNEGGDQGGNSGNDGGNGNQGGDSGDNGDNGGNVGGTTPPANGSVYRTGWAELPIECDADGNGIDDNDATLYYAHHLCAGSEKNAQKNGSARNYTVCFSSKHHCPVWVAAPRHNCYEGSSGRTDAYQKDPKIPASIQYNSKSTGGGCNKGHMVGSAERTCSSATNRQVFYYTNIAPQYTSSFNTGGGAWNNLEDKVDGWVCADTLYVVVGCYFDKFSDKRGNTANPATIEFGGRNDVSRPTMFYYALLRTKKGNTKKAVWDCSADELQCAAFVKCHEAPKGSSVSSQDMISISELEKLTGFSYFPNVPNAPKSSYKASDWGL